MNLTYPLSKLFRWRPVTAWGITGIMIAVACALNSGLTIDWINLLLVGLAILIIQGIIAHGVNDLADEEVDRIAPIEETGRSKVLVSGEMSRSYLFAVTSAAVLAVLLIIILLQMRAGIYVLLFAGIAAYAVFGYSAKPLRLGWRPFSELTIVVPAIAAMICGAEYVMISTVTPLALTMGISYGFFNAGWFMYSRAQDYEADKELGKRTTIVHFGLDSTSMFAVIYLVLSSMYAIYTATLVEWYTAASIIGVCMIPASFYVLEIWCLDNRYVVTSSQPPEGGGLPASWNAQWRISTGLNSTQSVPTYNFANISPALSALRDKLCSIQMYLNVLVRHSSPSLKGGGLLPRFFINPTPASYAKLRLQGMKYAVVYGVCASLAIIIFRGIVP